MKRGDHHRPDYGQNAALEGHYTTLFRSSTPHDTEDAEVGSQEGTHQGEAPEAPQGGLPDFAPDSTSEPAVVPESGRRPLCTKGKTVTPAASVQPEAPDNLLEALQSASIEEEHRTIMSAVIQKV